jgi:hypothetical protein
LRLGGVWGVDFACLRQCRVLLPLLQPVLLALLMACLPQAPRRLHYTLRLFSLACHLATPWCCGLSRRWSTATLIREWQSWCQECSSSTRCVQGVGWVWDGVGAIRGAVAGGGCKTHSKGGF